MIQHFLYSAYVLCATHIEMTIGVVSGIVASFMIRIAYMDMKGRYDHPERKTSEYLDYKEWNK